MDQTAEQFLRKFATEASDWRLLYQFTIYIYRRGLKTDHHTVREYLINHGWPLRKATWLCTEYRRFLELLALYDEGCTPADPLRPDLGIRIAP